MEQNLRIADLISAYLQRRLTPDEEKELDDWLEARPEHRALFAKIVNEQNLDADLAAIKFFDTAAALEKIRKYPQPPAKNKILYLRWPRIAAAASVLLILSAASYFLLKPKQQQQQIAQNQIHDISPGHNQATLTLANGKKIILTPGLSGILATQGKTTIQASNNHIAYHNTQTADQLVYNTLSTARGEQSPYPLVLADGTKVWLNAQSSITFPTVFNQKERIVKLSGEAYFEVKHNAAQSFKVQTANQTIEDIGTSFDVNAYGDEPATTTTLVEGSVKLGSVVLKPGQQFNGSKVTAVSTGQYTAWKNGDFDFRGDRIESVMRQLARWYDIEVVYQSGLQDKVAYAQIARSKNISAVLSLLEATKGIRFKVEGRRVTVIE